MLDPWEMPSGANQWICSFELLIDHVNYFTEEANDSITVYRSNFTMFSNRCQNCDESELGAQQIVVVNCAVNYMTSFDRWNILAELFGYYDIGDILRFMIMKCSVTTYARENVTNLKLFFGQQCCLCALLIAQ